MNAILNAREDTPTKARDSRDSVSCQRECHRNKDPRMVEMIEDYIEEA